MPCRPLSAILALLTMLIAAAPANAGNQVTPGTQPKSIRNADLDACLADDDAAHPDAVRIACSKVVLSATSTSAERAIALTARGIFYHRKGQPDEALADLNQAIALKSTIALAYLERGRIYLETAATEKAGSDFDQAAKLAPDSYSVQKTHADYYIDRGHADEARPIVAHFRASWPDEATVYYTAGRLDDLDNAFGREIDDLTTALDHAGKHANNESELAYYHGSRALVYALVGNVGAADQDLQAATTLKPNDVVIASYRCLTLSYRGKLTDAAPVCDQAIQTVDGQDPSDHAYALDCHSYLRMRQGDWAAARQDLDTATKLDPSPFYQFDRAYAEEHVGDQDAADKDYAKARAGYLHIEMEEARYGIIPGAKELIPQRQSLTAAP